MRRGHESFVLLTKAYHGGVVISADTAVGVATAILRGHYGKAEVARQKPLRATDEGASWLVGGSYRDPDLEPEGGGSWYIRIMKDDGRVVALGHRIAALELTDELKALAERSGGGKPGPA
jgi:hypothetical protein